MNDILVDTNIYLYALNADSDFHSRCCHLLNNNLNLYTTVKNISEYFAVCSKLKLDHEIVCDPRMIGLSRGRRAEGCQIVVRRSNTFTHQHFNASTL